MLFILGLGLMIFKNITKCNNIFATNTPEDIMEKYYCELHSFLDGDENCPDCKSGRVELPVKPASGGQYQEGILKAINIMEEVFLLNTQDYPKEYHDLFAKKLAQIKSRLSV